MKEAPDPEDGCGLLQFASSYPTKHFCRRTTGEVRKATNPPQGQELSDGLCALLPGTSG